VTEAQARVVEEQRLVVLAECAGRSRSLIVRLSTDAKRRLFYLSPSGLFRRCR